MYMTFYLKYRPQTVQDLDIESVRLGLKNILQSENIPHAFLFSGPKGTGKTSTARIVAKAINCEKRGDRKKEEFEPCNQCKTCISITDGANMDVIEIDAASNRGIEDIRILIESVKLAPSKAKAKVYIIDEAHMLTTEASNALLKTLEEPPSHVYFILATTNPEKIINTIKSRTFIINFTNATEEELKRSLERIIKKEKLVISDREIKQIINRAGGSFRDAVKILEIFSIDKNVLKNLLDFDEKLLLDLILKKNVEKSLVYLNESIKNGNTVNDILQKLVSLLRSRIIENKSESEIHLIELLLKSQELSKFSPIEELPLEMAVIKWCKIS